MARETKNLKARQREVKPDFSRGHKYQVVQYWRPTFVQRVKMMIGFNVIVGVQMFTEHKPGRVATAIVPQLTKFSSKDLKENPSLETLEPTQPGETKTAQELGQQTPENPSLEKASA